MLREIMRSMRLIPTERTVRWLDKDLAITCFSGETDWAAMRSDGVCGVVDLSEVSDELGGIVRQNGMRYLSLRVKNARLPKIDEMHIVTSWILQRISDDGPVLVHESQCSGNNALVACAALVKRGMNSAAALSCIRSAYPEPFSESQLDLLRDFAVQQ